jgi:hypothetical protein
LCYTFEVLFGGHFSATLQIYGFSQHRWSDDHWRKLRMQIWHNGLSRFLVDDHVTLYIKLQLAAYKVMGNHGHITTIFNWLSSRLNSGYDLWIKLFYDGPVFQLQCWMLPPANVTNTSVQKLLGKTIRLLIRSMHTISDAKIAAGHD